MSRYSGKSIAITTERRAFMKVRNLLILLLVSILIFAFAYAVIFGVSFGIKEFTPLRAVKQGLDLTGGVSIVYEAADPNEADLTTKIQGAMDIFRSRLDSKGFTEATITKQGTDQIRVEVPINKTSAIQDPTEIVSFIGKPAVLQFLKPDGTVIVEGSDIVSAKPLVDEKGGYVVSFEMTDKGGDAFAAATREIAKYSDLSTRYITITLDKVTISQATVNKEIPGGDGLIESSEFTQESASELAMQIESGALPVNLNVIEQRTISATLGDEALRNSILAGIVGLIVLLLFMIVVYRVPGLMADIALICYIGLVLFLIAWFGIQLTLPGIAGIILGVGMAVDANVIIFARIKEEYREGKTLRASLKSGFNKATTAIIDSNVTTIIAAFVLLLYGTGSIKGFAYTLGISILVSMVTALAVTQGLMHLLIGIAPKGTKMYFRVHKNRGGAQQ